MSLFQSTVMPDLKEPSDTTGVRKMGLDLLAKINKVWDVVVSLTNSSGVYDTGSNDNGSWIRWNNGVMQCWFYQTGGTAIQTWTFPKSFIDTSTVINSTLSASGSGFATVSALTTTSVNTYGWVVGGPNASNRYVTAIGRWK